MGRGIVGYAVVLLLNTGCSLLQKSPFPDTHSNGSSTQSFAQEVEDIQVPQDERARKSLCNWLRQNKAGATSIFDQPLPPQYTDNALEGVGNALQGIALQNNKRQSRENIAAIDQKMAEAACDQPSMPSTSSKRSGPELEQCVKTCETLTNRDSAACFKDCSQ